MPFFVSANHEVGGRMVGELILNSRGKRYDVVMVACGPPASGPAALRTKNLLLTLVKRGFQGRIVGFEVDRWDADQAIAGIRASLAGLSTVAYPSGVPQKVVIFCGNDAICVRVSNYLSQNPVSGFEIDLVGYDGVREANNDLFAATARHCIGTVDTNPKRLGGLAGSIVQKCYRGYDERQKNHQVEPSLEAFR
jgi:ABC-type sugar transport system substrate-binding protein